jgi:2-C-methyl-D-erythritol 2,4-cyclodiphosphate synthase
VKFRVGQGWDIHRLGPDRFLVLGGVSVPSPLGEIGHSDGDVLLHAIVDAMLGAAAAGDIGRHFPPSDPQWKDAPSRTFVERAVRILADSGWRLVNVDSTVILERPRLAPFIDSIRTSIAGMLGLPGDAVSVKAKTHEGVDAAGRMEAVEAQAVVLVERIGS